MDAITSTIPIYDISGAKPVLGDMPQQNIPEAIASGKYSLPQGATVPFMSPDGQEGTVPAENVKDALAQGYTPATHEAVMQARYGTGTQQAITGLEGAAKGVLGPLAPAAEKFAGVDPEEITARQEANPGTHMAGEIAGLAGSTMAGVGLGGALAKAGSLVKIGEGVSIGSKIATGASAAAIEGALYQTSDEMSKYIQNDPKSSVESALVNIGASAAIGGVAGGAFTGVGALGVPSKAWKAFQGTKVGEFVNDFSSRIKQEIHPEAGLNIGAANTIDAIKPKVSSNPGAKAADFLINKIKDMEPGAATGAVAGSMTGIPGAQWLGSKLGARLDPLIQKVMPSIMRAIVNNAPDGSAFKAAVDMGMNVIKGESMINQAAKSIFNSASIVNTTHQIDKLNLAVDAFKKNPQSLMNINRSTAHYMPDHDQALAMSNVRVLNYLSSLKPNVSPQTPMDSERVVSKVEQARYDNALKIGEQPLLILNKVRTGTLTPEDIKDAYAMYPALMPKFQQKVTENLITAKTDGKTIPYKTQVNISMLLHQPIAGSMSPQSIQSTQPNPQMPQQQKPSKQGTSAMSKSISMGMTPNQLRESRAANERS